VSHIIVVQPDGSVKFIYDDALKEIMNLGDFVVKRASRVEPTPEGKWTADMELSGGPVLGPFETRAEALEAEKVWLRFEILGSPSSDTIRET